MRAVCTFAGGWAWAGTACSRSSNCPSSHIADKTVSYVPPIHGHSSKNSPELAWLSTVMAHPLEPPSFLLSATKCETHRGRRYGHRATGRRRTSAATCLGIGRGNAQAHLHRQRHYELILRAKSFAPDKTDDYQCSNSCCCSYNVESALTVQHCVAVFVLGWGRPAEASPQHVLSELVHLW